jgi:hypothetical protein
VLAGGTAVRANASKRLGVVTPVGNPEVAMPLLGMRATKTVMAAGSVIHGDALV